MTLLREVHGMGAGRDTCTHTQPAAAVTGTWEWVVQDLGVLRFSES